MRKSQQPQVNVSLRIAIVMAFLLCFFFVVVVRAFSMQVQSSDFYQSQADIRHVREVEIPVSRGAIYDRNEEPLALSSPMESVGINPTKLLNQFSKVDQLAEVLDLNADKLKQIITSHKEKHFLYVKRRITPSVADSVRALDVDGVTFRTEFKRFYPTGEISSHIVGFTNVDDKGIEGIERVYNSLLTGTDGTKRYRKDAKGRKIEILAEEKSKEPQDLTLSIDQRIQAIAYRELKGAVQAFKATSGSVVVTNIHTGEILALVNSPSYNPNNRRNTAMHRFRNRAITDVYEPGSTMKPLTVLTALEFGSAKSKDIINTSPGWMRLGGRRVSDPINRGNLSLEEILVHSSNMGTAKLALSVPKNYLLDKFFEAGFASDTGTGLIGESTGMMPDRHRWSKFELATLSFGYGLAITPLQLARFYTTLANGGMKRPLTIVKQDNVRSDYAIEERVYSAEYSQDIVEMLEAVVDKHTPRAKVEGYRVSGKTGTSRKSIAGGYGNDYVGLFAGIAPVSAPELAVVVVINEPGGDLYHGGEVAAPVFSRVMKGALRVLNVAPDAESVASHTLKSNDKQLTKPAKQKKEKGRDHV